MYIAIVGDNWRPHVVELEIGDAWEKKLEFDLDLGLGKQKRGEPTRARAQGRLAQRGGLELFDHQAILEQSCKELGLSDKGRDTLRRRPVWCGSAHPSVRPLIPVSIYLLTFTETIDEA